jgi:hypothetical protein
VRKILSSLVILGLVMFVVQVFIVPRDKQEKSVFQYSKSEYVAQAVSNCEKDGTPTEYCRCFYQTFLETRTVAEVIKFDVSAGRDDYVVPDEVLRIIDKCL